MSRCWYVVLEWNQAGGRPRLVSDDLHDDLTDALGVAEREAMVTAKVGRGERYSVHEIGWDEIDEDVTA